MVSTGCASAVAAVRRTVHVAGDRHDQDRIPLSPDDCQPGLSQAHPALVWSVHRGQKRHTTATEQIELLNYVRSLLPTGSQVWVLGDAGFQSVHLLRWLARQHWHFVIRQPGNNPERLENKRLVRKLPYPNQITRNPKPG